MVKTRPASAASSIRRRSAACTILLDSMCRSRKRASASSMMPGIALGPVRVGARQRLNDQREAVSEVIARSAVLAKNDIGSRHAGFVGRHGARAGAPAVSGRVWPPAAGLPYASGDELVSLGFRVGNPSAIGRHERVNFPASLLPVGATPTTSRRIATHGLRRKMARSRTEGMAVGHVFSSQEGQKPSPRWGSFFCRAGAAPGSGLMHCSKCLGPRG